MSKKKRSFRRKSQSRDFLVGRLFVNRKGNGFVEAHDQEYFISRKNCNGAMDGDTIAFRPMGTNSFGKTARVARIVERKHSTIVGQFEQFGALSVVIPRDKRIAYDAFVDADHTCGACPGDWVTATICAYPTRHESLQVAITEIVQSALPNEGPQVVPESVILASNDIESGFSDEALREAEKAFMPTAEAALSDGFRKDLRERSIFTIDPKDARDFDDAISIERIGDKVRLGVHIADVSSFVPLDSALDVDARKKSTSTYIPTGVIPMLPEQLSNGLCSLNPNEERLALSVDITFDKNWNIISTDAYQSLIKSRNRYSYDEVLNMLEGAEEYRSPEQREALTLFHEVNKKLAQRRIDRGGLDFNTREAKVMCDKDGVPYDIAIRTKNDATEMVEEAMILANEVVATRLFNAHVASVFRVHEPPNADALDGITEILKEFGYRLQAQSEISSAAFQQILGAAQGKPEEYLVSTTLLRTLKQAYYSPEPVGHFGLASDYYTHFTSPIRRYPDLIVHRLLTAYLRGELADERLIEMQENLSALCHHCSVGERNAQNAEREATRYKLCEYMQKKVGETFEGIVSNVSHFGFFVTLENSAEGLVHISHISHTERWGYDARKHALVNEKHTKHYRLGQPIRVVLLSVNLEEGLLDFTLAE